MRTAWLLTGDQRSEGGFTPRYGYACRYFDVLDRPHRSRGRVVDADRRRGAAPLRGWNFVIEVQTPTYQTRLRFGRRLCHLQNQRRSTTHYDLFAFVQYSLFQLFEQSLVMSEQLTLHFFGATVGFPDCGLRPVAARPGLLTCGQGYASAIMFTCELYCFASTTHNQWMTVTPSF